ncbi:glycosyltransferase group 2 [Erwinia sp. OLTSP20]|uniref:glycosyltransferase family A protein n=1 Tax=unclassified Erwinia TaxID=2622719 RepID=UPI000C174D88|nr:MULTISPECIES: glycosyltransferase family A protein [unclassified Erwinia]PIJ48574.1 glycosyltransferase group 2 [Erwinia sp. OAMSP11]PIJ68758.1 glycosyltransferase group 2 [Erwinia sp. OLSSP12]PIJ79322.1 glycosyltransferase group 2 [Erwinia sp. OLCASP19]PIJ79505.1 glycosyltransferase group 2 [Erwinia sp. OLMTSP26]PIJ81706.1 glycosyltransferase group 2 [Erwinia sp. OLMDSP33]
MNDWQHIRLTYVTHFYCNQGNIDSVLSLLRSYEHYPKDILDSTHFVIVDDCSSVEYEVPALNLNLTWLRIDDDIPWNQGGARNLGVTYAKSDKILMTDLDHQLPEDTFRYLITHKNPGRSFYKIYRNDPATGKLIKGHSNLFFMSRARFFRHHGYDEEFCGHYGAEDYRFVKYHKYHGSVQRYLPRRIRCDIREIDRESSYHSLNRDLSFNTPVDLKKAEEIATYGAEHGHSRNFLNFRWHIVTISSRTPDKPQPRRWWKPLWWFRCLIAPLAR